MRENNPSFSLVIPLYNNEETLQDQIQSCIAVVSGIAQQWEIIIANDSSKDGSRKLLAVFSKDKRIRIYHHKQNKGIAKNLFFLYSKARYDIVGLFSVDGDWNSKDIAKMYRILQNRSADMVIGRRAIKKYGISRKIISYAYRFLPLLLFKVDIIDPGSIKVFKRSLFTNQTFISTSVFFEAEMIIKAFYSSKKIIAVTIQHKKRSMNATGGQLKYVLPSFIDLIKLRIHGSQ